MEIDEKRLLELAQLGDIGAFGVLFERCRASVERTIRWVFQSQDIEDVVQETFLRGYNRIAAFRGEGNISSWLCRIARNACYDYFRKAGRKAEVSLDDESLPVDRFECLAVKPQYEDLELSEDQKELVLQLGLSKLNEQEALAIQLTWFDAEPRSAEEVRAMVGFTTRQQVYDTTQKLIRICRRHAVALRRFTFVPQSARRSP